MRKGSPSSTAATHKQWSGKKYASGRAAQNDGSRNKLCTSTSELQAKRKGPSVLNANAHSGQILNFRNRTHLNISQDVVGVPEQENQPSNVFPKHQFLGLHAFFPFLWFARLFVSRRCRWVYPPETCYVSHFSHFVFTAEFFKMGVLGSLLTVESTIRKFPEARQPENCTAMTQFCTASLQGIHHVPPKSVSKLHWN